MKKLIAAFSIMCLLLCLSPQFVFTANAETVNTSRQLKALGNKLVYVDDENAEVTLSGVNVCGGEWLGNLSNGYIKQSLKVALNDWDSNIIRLGVSAEGWWGEYDYIHDGGLTYRSYLDDVIEQVGAAGKYLILDYHHYNFVDERTMSFWHEAAERYKNNPAVLFGLLNEPTGITWNEWRNGNGAENCGVQALVESIRDLGARNLLVIGGISWSGELRGIVGENNYAISDCGSNGDTGKTGFGIMYDCHIYPYNTSTSVYDMKFGEARKLYPILIGEYGWDPNATNVVGAEAMNELSQRYHTKWFYELYAWMNDEITYGAKANSTAWCFHPSAGPRLLKATDENGYSLGNPNYSYPPTDFFGVYAKEYLKLQMGRNILHNKRITEYTVGRPANANDPNFAIDGDDTTYWSCGSSREKEIVIDLGGMFNLTRWQLKHGGTLYAYDLLVSTDGTQWTVADSIINEKYADNTDRYISPVTARYVKLYVSSDNSLLKIYDFAVIGRDVKQQAGIGVPSLADTSDVVANCREMDFYRGDKISCWYSGGNYPEYIENGAEDLSGTIMRLRDKSSPQFALNSTYFSDFIYFDYFSFKYKSSYNVSLNIALVYQATNEKKSSKTVTLPSTGGEWQEIRITANDLMPDQNGDWVKYGLKTVYSNAESAYMPVVMMYMNTSGTGYADFEYIRGNWNLNSGLKMTELSFINGGLSANSGMLPGITDVTVRFRSETTTYMNGLFVAAASYDGGGTLLDIDYKSFNISPNANSEPYILSVSNDDASGHVKVFVWRSGDILQPIMHTIRYTSEGVQFE